MGKSFDSSKSFNISSLTLTTIPEVCWIRFDPQEFYRTKQQQKHYHDVSPPHQLGPGDTVWWHPDVLHHLEEWNTSAAYNSVLYLSGCKFCTDHHIKRVLRMPGKVFFSGEKKFLSPYCLKIGKASVCASFSRYNVCCCLFCGCLNILMVMALILNLNDSF